MHSDSQKTGSTTAPQMGFPANIPVHPYTQQAVSSTGPSPQQIGYPYWQPAPQNNTAAPYTKAFSFNGVPSAEGSSSTRTKNGAMALQPGGSYIRTDPVPVQGPLDSVLQNLGKWGKKAEVFAGNVWNHLKTGPSLSDTAWGKLNQGTKLLCEGGLESIFKTSFEVSANEQLRKSYACYLSVSTGPVAGTLFISTAKIAFLSDRPLPYGYFSGKQAYSYYKVVIPLEHLKAVNPSSNYEKPAEKYIQIVTVDNFEFWFMGFVNFDKGLKNLQEAALFGGATR